ncbi:hypothetical protein C8N31_1332 [Sulfitobacter mediterraneus]|uniref:Uncharacterized protein n=1 Tax=Sulfitobacter mediterraneus TaxID=83219 RepID=A0A2T6BSV8_9RHOB|nr:hypothetical protein C8N31_1332 [Sulfitobacter mediterraneus]
MGSLSDHLRGEMLVSGLSMITLPAELKDALRGTLLVTGDCDGQYLLSPQKCPPRFALASSALATECPQKCPTFGLPPAKPMKAIEGVGFLPSQPLSHT